MQTRRARLHVGLGQRPGRGSMLVASGEITAEAFARSNSAAARMVCKAVPLAGPPGY